MNESIRSLLDEAVAGVQPRVSDPIPAVIRRSRQARLRALAVAGAAGVVAVTLIATGGILAANRTTAAVGRALSPQAEKYASLARLNAQVDGTVIRTGGLAISMPNGWQVLRDRTLAYCSIPPNSVLINVRELSNGECDPHPQVSLSYWEPTTVNSAPAPSPPGPSATGPSAGLPVAGTQSSVAGSWESTVNEVVLPGGQPLWLTPIEVIRVREALQQGAAGLTLAMPWANARIDVNAPPAQTNIVLSGIRSALVVPARLVLPGEFAAVQVNVRGKDQIVSTDKAAVGRVVALLRKLGRPVLSGELPCVGAKVLTKAWRLAGTDMATIKFVSSTSVVTGVVAISAADGCSFATSSLGGRVHVPANILTQIQQLLGDR